LPERGGDGTQEEGYAIIREKGSVRYYFKPGCEKLIRVDYHGTHEVPKGTCEAILKVSTARGFVYQETGKKVK
jgi:predicted RNA binding protein YcfA (HicA-like mRNA interferase family)